MGCNFRPCPKFNGGLTTPPLILGPGWVINFPCPNLDAGWANLCYWKWSPDHSGLNTTGVNTLRPRQNGGHFADDTFKRISLNEKMLEFRSKFHWSLFLRAQLTISQHWFWWWLGANHATRHYLNHPWLVYRRIYASPGPNGLRALHFSNYSAKRTGAIC